MENLFFNIQLPSIKNMYFPKSNPDLNVVPGRRSSRRESRGVRNSRQIRDSEYKVSNPFRNIDQQNLLPPYIQAQIQQEQFISTNSIKKIQFHQIRRVSGLAKNLQMMQMLAKKQEQKYSGMLKQGTKASTRKNQTYQNEMMPINIIEDDQISLQLNGFYDYKERIDDDFNIFQNEDNPCYMTEQPMFYSKQQIELTYEMDEEVNNYLG